jgi:hypothetical protein
LKARREHKWQLECAAFHTAEGPELEAIFLERVQNCRDPPEGEAALREQSPNRDERQLDPAGFSTANLGNRRWM